MTILQSASAPATMAPVAAPRSVSRAKIALAALAMAATAGCATMGGQTPEQKVQARAEAFWKARIAGDAKASYALMTPAYRGLRDEPSFVKQFGERAPVIKSEITKVTCEDAEKCIAQVGLTAKPMVPGLALPTVTGYIDETWLLVDGQWWRHEAP
jgi:hypothetical protein